MMAAIGAVMLITRTRNPRQVYDEVDWGLLIFFVGLFVIVGGAENAGLINHLFAAADRLNLQNAGVFTAITALLSNIVVSNVPAVMVLKSLVPSFHDPQAARDGKLGVVDRERPVRVVEQELDLAEVGRPAVGSACEEDVVRLLRAQLARAERAGRPADRVGDVRLAGAVRADDDADARLEAYLDRLGKRLEATELYRAEMHVAMTLPSLTDG